MLTSNSIKDRVRLSNTVRRTYFTLSYNDNLEELEFMNRSHELFRRGEFIPHEVSDFVLSSSLAGRYESEFDFDVDKLDLLHFCSHNDYLDIDRTIKRKEWKGRNNLSILLVQYKPDRYVWFDLTHRVTGKWISEIYTRQNRIYKIVICDNILATKIMSDSYDCSSLLFDWDKLIDMANTNEVDCVIVDFDNKRPVKSNIYVDASNKNEYNSISNLMRLMPEQQAQWMYYFPDNLNCNLKSVNFYNLFQYSETWITNLLIELSYNPEFIKMKKDCCREYVLDFLAKQYSEAYGEINERTLCPIFDATDYSVPESWEAALENLDSILPNDIMAIRMSRCHVKINGTTYWHESDYYKIQDVSGNGYDMLGVMVSYPLRFQSHFEREPNRQDFPSINSYLKCDVLFPKKSLTAAERSMVYKFEKQYSTAMEEDETLSLFLKEGDCYKVEAPYLINRRLPLPMIITGYNDIYTLICKRSDEVEILA